MGEHSAGPASPTSDSSPVESALEEPSPSSEGMHSGLGQQGAERGGQQRKGSRDRARITHAARAAAAGFGVMVGARMGPWRCGEERVCQRNPWLLAVLCQQ